MMAKRPLGSAGSWVVSTTSLAFVLVLAPGCFDRDESSGAVFRAKGDESPVVARVGDHPITALELKSHVFDRSVSNRQRLIREDFEQWLDERVLEEILYQEALRQELDRDAEIRRDVRQMLVSRLMHDHLEQEVWSREFEPAEIQAYYDAHEGEFNRPEQVRIADIFIAVPANAGEEERSGLQAKAETVLARALEAREERSGFSKLIAGFSDTPENYRKGDTGFFDTEGTPIGIDREIVEAAFSLQQVGSMHERAIETADGYHVIMLTGKRSGLHIPLENVRDTLVQRMRREAADEARTAFMDGLRASAKIRVNDGALDDLLEEWNRQVLAGRPAPSRGIPSLSAEGVHPPALPQAP